MTLARITYEHYRRHLAETVYYVRVSSTGRDVDVEVVVSYNGLTTSRNLDKAKASEHEAACRCVSRHRKEQGKV